MQQHPHQLPDGRHPVKYGKGRTAIYLKARGEGFVEYPFSMIKYMQANRPRKPQSEIQRIHKEMAAQRLKNDPEYFKRIGSAGGKKTKHDRKSKQQQEGQGA